MDDARARETSALLVRHWRQGSVRAGLPLAQQPATCGGEHSRHRARHIEALVR